MINITILGNGKTIIIITIVNRHPSPQHHDQDHDDHHDGDDDDDDDHDHRHHEENSLEIKMVNYNGFSDLHQFPQHLPPLPAQPCSILPSASSSSSPWSPL